MAVNPTVARHVVHGAEAACNRFVTAATRERQPIVYHVLSARSRDRLPLPQCLESGGQVDDFRNSRTTSKWIRRYAGEGGPGRGERFATAPPRSRGLSAPAFQDQYEALSPPNFGRKSSGRRSRCLARPLGRDDRRRIDCIQAVTTRW
jgi:hypothetical protein